VYFKDLKILFTLGINMFNHDKTIFDNLPWKLQVQFSIFIDNLPCSTPPNFPWQEKTPLGGVSGVPKRFLPIANPAAARWLTNSSRYFCETWAGQSSINSYQ
jgi:hypothetical protein